VFLAKRCTAQLARKRTKVSWRRGEGGHSVVTLKDRPPFSSAYGPIKQGRGKKLRGEGGMIHLGKGGETGTY